MPPKRSARPWLNDYLPRKSPKPRFTNLADRDMEYATLEAREASFVPPTKRSKAGWPHKSPSPRDLARAGFFYRPTSSRDNVECFVCGRQLDGWEEDDNALQEHLKHGPDCAWALLMSIELETAFETTSMDDPTGAHLTEARRNTFETIGWPHEQKRGWTCKTDKMVEAGWHFAPTTECEDYVSCVYCKLSLDGWEPKDNPFEEHQRRSPECPFFVFAGMTAPSKRPKAKKGRASKASRSSKASRLSMQSNTTMLSQADESTGIIEILGVDTSMEDMGDNSIVSIQSTASTATAKPKRKAPTRVKGSVSKKPKTTRGKKKQPDPEADLELEVEPETQPELETQPTQEMSQSQGTQDIQSTLEVSEVSNEQPKLKKSRSKKKKKASTPEPEAELQQDSEIVPEDVRQKTSEQPKRKVSRGKKQLEPKPTSLPKQQPEIIRIESDAEAEATEERIQQNESSYPSLPVETPDEFEDAAEILQDTSATHQKDNMQTGPPEKENSPIPVKQTSPLKEISNPPRPTISPAQTQQPAAKRRSSQRSRTQTSLGRTSVIQATEPVLSHSPSPPASTSDIENRPPATPRGAQSPGATQSQWTPIDIDTIFQPGELDLFGGAVTGNLSEAEKQMTVQEWISFIADQAEARLSAEGENIVSIFEGEGRRAMGVLERIECV